jgi:hypothetical protein
MSHIVKLLQSKRSNAAVVRYCGIVLTRPDKVALRRRRVLFGQIQAEDGTLVHDNHGLFMYLFVDEQQRRAMLSLWLVMFASPK